MSPDPADESGALAAKGLRHAGYAALFVVALWLLMVFAPGTPLVDEAACEAVPAADCSILLGVSTSKVREKALLHTCFQ